MKLSQYLDGMRAASTADELDAAISAPYRHSYLGRTWATICRVRRERATAICQGHPDGRFVPLATGRTLMLCGESFNLRTYKNSLGQPHSPESWAKTVLKANGMSQRAAARIWGTGSYPHRALALVAAARAGELTDPVMNTPVFCDGHGPVNISTEENDADDLDRRATMPCACGGTLFDWGCGFSDDFTFVKWHCNKCPKVATEFVTPERFREIRQPACPTIEAASKETDQGTIDACS